MFLLEWFSSLLRLLGLSSKKARIVILGLDNAGKSTLLHKLCSDELRAFVPTTKAHAKTFSLGSITFTAWDLGGHEQVRDLWEEYYAGADAIVFLVDSADPARFDEAKSEMDQLLAADELTDVPILVLGNKCDIPVPLLARRVHPGLVELQPASRSCQRASPLPPPARARSLALLPMCLPVACHSADTL